MSSPMEQGMSMPASRGHRKFGMLGVALTMVGVVVVVIRQSNVVTKREKSALADMTTQLAAGDCSEADRSILNPMGASFADTFSSCASYSVWSGWDSDTTASCIADAIQISNACAHCFSDAVGYAYDNCRSGDCTSDQCGQGCADCLAPAKHTAESCVGGDIVQRGYTLAMHVSCRPGISGMVSADDCTADTGLPCSSSSDCPTWSGSTCIGGTCQCDAPHTCSVNDGECVAPGGCPKFTGGTCAYMGCNAIRNAQCVGAWGAGKCLCSDDQCVDDGTCVAASSL